MKEGIKHNVFEVQGQTFCVGVKIRDLRLNRPLIGAGNDFRVKIGSIEARCKRDEVVGQVSLAGFISAILQGSKTTEQVNVIVINDNEASSAKYWLLSFYKGLPVFGQDFVFATRDELTAGIKRETQDTYLIANDKEGAALALSLSQEFTNKKFEDIDLDPSPQNLPRFERAPRISYKVAAFAGSLLSLMGGLGALGYDQYQSAHNPQYDEIERTTYYKTDWQAFASDCFRSLQTPEPGVGGFNPFEIGCETNGGAAQSVRRQKLMPEFNEIIASRVSARVFEDWPHDHKVEDRTLETRVGFDLHREVVTSPVTAMSTAHMLEHVENTFAANLDRVEIVSSDEVQARIKGSLSETLASFSLPAGMGFRSAFEQSTANSVITVLILASDAGQRESIIERILIP